MTLRDTLITAVDGAMTYLSTVARGNANVLIGLARNHVPADAPIILPPGLSPEPESAVTFLHELEAAVRPHLPANFHWLLALVLGIVRDHVAAAAWHAVFAPDARYTHPIPDGTARMAMDVSVLGSCDVRC